MSRPKTPTRILESKGSFKKDPQRARPNEPEVTTPIGNAPDYMTPEQIAAWRELVSAAPPLVLTGSDRVTLEMACCLLAEFRADPGEFLAAKLTRLQSLLAQFGMSPSARASMGVSKPKKENAFAAWEREFPR
jgi:phage terminase small subunit